LNRKFAADGIVLLKNENHVLPLDASKIKTLAVVGPNINVRTVSGGGSAYLSSSYVVTPLEGIRRAAQEHGIKVKAEIGCYGELNVRT
jgi:beta-glucosidase